MARIDCFLCGCMLNLNVSYDGTPPAVALGDIQAICGDCGLTNEIRIEPIDPGPANEKSE